MSFRETNLRRRPNVSECWSAKEGRSGRSSRYLGRMNGSLLSTPLSTSFVPKSSENGPFKTVQFGLRRWRVVFSRSSTTIWLCRRLVTLAQSDQAATFGQKALIRQWLMKTRDPNVVRGLSSEWSIDAGNYSHQSQPLRVWPTAPVFLARLARARALCALLPVSSISSLSRICPR